MLVLQLTGSHMRTTLLFILSLGFSTALWSNEPTWFVSVHGESMQLISGAAATPQVSDGVFLDKDYAGNLIYVRTVKGYELDGFRPIESEGAVTATSMVSEAADSAANTGLVKAKPSSEFGPMTDTGVQYILNHDYFGWYCAKMYVKPMGNGVDRLRCDKEMRHER